jgi:hypothetical protein
VQVGGVEGVVGRERRRKGGREGECLKVENKHAKRGERKMSV